jgi:hypothetical protein
VSGHRTKQMIGPRRPESLTACGLPPHAHSRRARDQSSGRTRNRISYNWRVRTGDGRRSAYLGGDGMQLEELAGPLVLDCDRDVVRVQAHFFCSATGACSLGVTWRRPVEGWLLPRFAVRGRDRHFFLSCDVSRYRIGNDFCVCRGLSRSEHRVAAPRVAGPGSPGLAPGPSKAVNRQHGHSIEDRASVAENSGACATL